MVPGSVLDTPVLVPGRVLDTPGLVGCLAWHLCEDLRHHLHGCLHQLPSNRTGYEEGSYSRLIDFCITQL